jgi:hypothetical protein
MADPSPPGSPEQPKLGKRTRPIEPSTRRLRSARAEDATSPGPNSAPASDPVTPPFASGSLPIESDQHPFLTAAPDLPDDPSLPPSPALPVTPDLHVDPPALPASDRDVSEDNNSSSPLSSPSSADSSFLPGSDSLSGSDDDDDDVSTDSISSLEIFDGSDTDNVHISTPASLPSLRTVSPDTDERAHSPPAPLSDERAASPAAPPAINLSSPSPSVSSESSEALPFMSPNDTAPVIAKEGKIPYIGEGKITHDVIGRFSSLALAFQAEISCSDAVLIAKLASKFSFNREMRSFWQTDGPSLKDAPYTDFFAALRGTIFGTDWALDVWRKLDSVAQADNEDVTAYIERCVELNSILEGSSYWLDDTSLRATIVRGLSTEMRSGVHAKPERLQKPK